MITHVHITIALLAWNLITFALYGIDKRKARKNKWRIRERTLILCAFLMGGAGAFLGMSLFRHKTKHIKFKILVPLAFALNVAVIVTVLWLFCLRQAQ